MLWLKTTLNLSLIYYLQNIQENRTRVEAETATNLKKPVIIEQRFPREADSR